MEHYNFHVFADVIFVADKENFLPFKISVGNNYISKFNFLKLQPLFRLESFFLFLRPTNKLFFTIKNPLIFRSSSQIYIARSSYLPFPKNSLMPFFISSIPPATNIINKRSPKIAFLNSQSKKPVAAPSCSRYIAGLSGR